MNITRFVRLVLVFAGLVTMPVGGGWRVSASPAPQNGAQAKGSQKTVQMRIAGMTCASCAKGLEASFRNMVGVVKVAVVIKPARLWSHSIRANKAPKAYPSSSRVAGTRSKRPR